MGLKVLDKALWWILSGNALFSDFNFIRGAFLVKGSQDHDSEEVLRGASETRPLGLKQTSNKILTGLVVSHLSKKLPEFIDCEQRGFVQGRNFG
eukprot:4313440-Pyramimonas_sp.AAC.1